MREWLDKVDATTSLDELITRPSAFNPYPEFAEDGVSIWEISNPTFNPLYTIRYDGQGLGCRVSLPISHPESQPETRPDLLPAGEISGGYQGVDETDPENWTEIGTWWKGLSVTLGSNYLQRRGGLEGATHVIADLIEANRQGQTQAGHIQPNPRSFVRAAITEAQSQTKGGSPAVAYAIAENMFRGFTSNSYGDRKIDNSPTATWVVYGLAEAVFPNFAKPWNTKLDPHRISTVAHPFSVGQSVESVVCNSLALPAIEAWLESFILGMDMEAVKKVELLQKSTARRQAGAEAALDVKLEEARNHFPEAMADKSGGMIGFWEIPRPLGNYVLTALAAAD